MSYMRIFATVELIEIDRACIGAPDKPKCLRRGQPVTFRTAPVVAPNKLYEFTADETNNFWFALHGRVLQWAKLIPNGVALTCGQCQHFAKLQR